MSEYANKLSALAEKKKKLLEEELKIIEKRKKDFGNFAEKFDLLTVSDSLILGLFSEFTDALKTKSSRLKEWENLGARFLKSTKSSAAKAQ